MIFVTFNQGPDCQKSMLSYLDANEVINFSLETTGASLG